MVNRQKFQKVSKEAVELALGAEKLLSRVSTGQMTMDLALGDEGAERASMRTTHL
jgi:hypothetical protein